MISDVIIFGELETAVYRDSEGWKAAQLNSDWSDVVDCTRLLGLVLTSRTERRQLSSVFDSVSELREPLSYWVSRHRALTMTISGFDRELKPATRKDSIALAEQMLENPDLHHFVQARLLGCTPPHSADLGEAINLAQRTGATKTLALYKILSNGRGRIKGLNKIIRRFLISSVWSDHNCEEMFRSLVDSGFVAEIALIIATGDASHQTRYAVEPHVRGKLIELVEKYEKDPIIQSTIQRPEELLRAIVEDRLTPRLSPRPLKLKAVAAILESGGRWTPTEDRLTGLEEIQEFVNSVWHTTPLLFPEKVRFSLLPILNDASETLRISTKETTPAEFLPAAVSRVRAHLYCSKIWDSIGKLDWRNRLGNLRSALLIADSSRFFSSRMEYLEETHLPLENEKVANDIPDDPEFLLTRAGLQDSNKEEETLEDAGVVLYFQARIQANRYGDRDYALALLRRSHKYFQTAFNKLNYESSARVRLIHRWTGAHMLEARETLYAGREGPQRAIMVLNRALNLLQSLRAEDFVKTEEPDHTRRANCIYQTEALLEKLLIKRDDTEAITKGESLFKDLILEKPEDAYVQHLLFEYYRRVGSHIDAALEHADKWIEHLKKLEPQTKTTIQLRHYVQFTAASLCAEGSGEDITLKIAAIERFARVLNDQPGNIKALEVLLMLAEETPTLWQTETYQRVDQILSQTRTGESHITHTCVRLFLDLVRDEHVPVTNPASALLAVVLNWAAHYSDARSVLLERASKGRWVGNILELMSKQYVRRGIRYNKHEDLEVADRLLGLALNIRPHDLIWLSRKIQVARLLNNQADFNHLIKRANHDFPNDHIIKYVTTGLMIRRGDRQSLERASQMLTQIAASQDKGRRDHPRVEVQDRLGYVSILLGNLDEAEKNYRAILDGNPEDGRALLGVGRVHFERGLAYWPKAFDSWVKAFLAQTSEPEPRASILLRQTGLWIASLMDQRYHRFSKDVRLDLLDKLASALRTDSRLAITLIRSLRVLGIVDAQVVKKIMSVLSQVRDRHLLGCAAQLFMAATIHSLLNVEGDRPEIPDMIKWCRTMEVVAEYLAGAKGSYGRAIVKRCAVGASLDDLQTHDLSKFSFATKEWSDLSDHIASMGYVANYYATVYQLFSRIHDPSLDELTEFVRLLIPKAACITIEYMKSNQMTFVHLVAPSITVCPLRQILKLDEHQVAGSPAFGGLGDADLLQFAEAQFAPQGDQWHMEGTELVRYTASVVDAKGIAAYAQSGLYLRLQPEAVRLKSMRCSIRLRWDFEEEAA